MIGAWAILLLLALPFAPRAGSALRAGGFSLDSLESARARTLLEDTLHLPPSAIAVVYTSDTLKAGSPAFEAAAAAASRDLFDAPHVVRVVPHQLNVRQVSADRTTAYDVLLLDYQPDQSPDILPILEPRLHHPAGIQVALAGGPAFYGDVQSVSESDLRRSEIISLPLAGVALVFVFGSLVAASVPLFVGGAAVAVALAVIFGVASLTPMSIFVLNLATLLGLGLGVDYSLLMTSRFREELARQRALLSTSRASGVGSAGPAGGGPGGGGPAPPLSEHALADLAVGRAVELTVATAGRAVFFSGLTVLLGLGGLILFEFMILRSVGIAGAIVVATAVAAALTLLPALLSILGPRLDGLAVRRVTVAGDGEGAWARLARRVMAHPVAVLVPTLALLLVLGVPFLHVRFNAPDATICRRPSRRAPPTSFSRESSERVSSHR